MQDASEMYISGIKQQSLTHSLNLIVSHYLMYVNSRY
jgi:hypothetical protein